MSDGNDLAEAMLGLEGFRVLEVAETPDELTVTVETTVVVAGCRECGAGVVAHDRRPVDMRDLACFGRPVRLLVLNPAVSPGPTAPHHPASQSANLHPDDKSHKKRTLS